MVLAFCIIDIQWFLIIITYGVQIVRFVVGDKSLRY